METDRTSNVVHTISFIVVAVAVVTLAIVAAVVVAVVVDAAVVVAAIVAVVIHTTSFGSHVAGGTTSVHNGLIVPGNNNSNISVNSNNNRNNSDSNSNSSNNNTAPSYRAICSTKATAIAATAEQHQ